MIISKYKITINCLKCGKELHVRNDYVKTHQGLCTVCSVKQLWESQEYRRIQSERHKGKKVAPKLAYGESNFNALFYTYYKSAEQRGLVFDITKEQFKVLTKQNCYYCGIEPLQVKEANSNRFTNGLWIHNGIDRLNDEIGYLITNVVPCCKKCNYAKQGLSDIEFLDHVRKIYEHHFKSDN